MFVVLYKSIFFIYSGSISGAAQNMPQIDLYSELFEFNNVEDNQFYIIEQQKNLINIIMIVLAIFIITVISFCISKIFCCFTSLSSKTNKKSKYYLKNDDESEI